MADRFTTIQEADLGGGKKGRKRVPLEGLVFGRLTVKKYSMETAKYVCLCECGKEKEAFGSDLKRGRVISCGCFYELFGRYKKHKNTPGGSTYGVIFTEYKSSAKKRGLEFSLSFDSLIKLSSLNCYYCNSPPTTFKNRYINSKTKQITTEAISHGIRPESIDNATVYINGIDRIDNSKGYTPENSRACCFPCNRAKAQMTEEEFLDWAKRLVENMGRK